LSGEPWNRVDGCMSCLAVPRGPRVIIEPCTRALHHDISAACLVIGDDEYPDTDKMRWVSEEFVALSRPGRLESILHDLLRLLLNFAQTRAVRGYEDDTALCEQKVTNGVGHRHGSAIRKSERCSWERTMWRLMMAWAWTVEPSGAVSNWMRQILRKASAVWWFALKKDEGEACHSSAHSA